MAFVIDNIESEISRLQDLSRQLKSNQVQIEIRNELDQSLTSDTPPKLVETRKAQLL